MWIYLLLYFSLAASALLARTKRAVTTSLWFWGTVLALFAGTRDAVGCDYIGYKLRFDNLYDHETWQSILTHAEPGFHALNFAVIQLGGSYHTLIFIVSVFYVFCLIQFSKIHDRPLDVVALMFPIMFVQLGMSGMRQAMAVGFLMLAMICFVRKRVIWTALWILCGSLFHASAIIFLPLAVLAKREFSMVRMIGALVVLGPISGYLLGDRLELYQARYIYQEFGENSSAGAWYRYAIAVIPFIAFEMRKQAIKHIYPQIFSLLRVFSLIAFTMPIAGLVSSVALHRLGFYVLPVSILALVSVGRVGFTDSSATASRHLAFFAYGIYLFVWFSYSRHAAVGYIPYRTWLF
ncbi:MAG: transmembrane protein EpsG [Pirellulaceae bacterium]|nr:MAG: transmembrane protein EpsG [Pirellulaceae bacterium]